MMHPYDLMNLQMIICVLLNKSDIFPTNPLVGDLFADDCKNVYVWTGHGWMDFRCRGFSRKTILHGRIT